MEAAMATISSEPGERWLPVPGFSLYQASNRGRVWSSYGKGRFLKPILWGPKGYERFGVTLSNGPIRWQVYIHKLVMLLFADACPEGKEIRHLDGNRFRNWYPENLAFGTHKENGEDMARHGSARAGAQRGHEHYRAKLTEDLVRQIRSEYTAGGVTERALASRHDVNVTTIHALLVRRTWTHVA
jgi:HNH endonuclease/NUMOD4 motif-containing protein